MLTCVCIQVMGSLADKKCAQGQRVSGILVKRNFSYHILTPSDLSSKLVLFPQNNQDPFCTARVLIILVLPF